MQFLRAASFLLLAALLCLTSSWVVQADDEDPGAVVVLTEDNFDDFVNQPSVQLVQFYAPWCGHCKSLSPVYKQAAADLLADNIPLGKVDATVHQALATRFKVQGYPTLKVFQNGEAFEYKGPRTAEGIASYMRKQAGPAVKPVMANLADVTQFALSDRATHFAILGFFETADADNSVQRVFGGVANEIRDQFVAGQVVGDAALDTLRALLKAAKLDTDVSLPAIVGVQTLGSTPDQPKLAVELASTTDLETSAALKDWVQKAALPLVGEFNDQTSSLFHKRGLPVVKLYTEVDWTASGNAKLARYFLVRLRKALVGHKDALVGALVNKGHTQAGIELDNMGLNPAAADFFLVVEELVSQKKFVYSPPVGAGKGWNPQAVQSWLAEYVAGKLSPHIRSEPEPTPEEIAADPVTKVVGTTLEKIVFNKEGKSVLLEVYAPWCGHCKALEPAWKAAAEELAEHNDQVIIAKLDGTANDYPRELFEVSGFPSIFWISGGDSSEIQDYQGGRDTADIVKFVQQQLKL